MNLKQDAVRLIQSSLMAALPDTAVKAALSEAKFGSGKLVLVAAGKAGWQMASAAVAALDEARASGAPIPNISRGVVVTKYGHSQGQIPGLTIYEAGHPVPDENSYRATQAAIDAVEGLSADDTVLFLLSGGGSALFEKPLIPAEDLQNLTQELLACGADIITFHLEAAEDPQAVIDEIRKYNCKAGISIKPKTPFEDVIPYMDKVDMLLVMTVEPGFGGQKMIPETLEKVRKARKYVTEKGLKTDIQVDGGVKYDNIHLPLEAGANIFVVGSAVFGDNTYGEAKRFSDYLAQQS